jgi:phage shock protein A
MQWLETFTLVMRSQMTSLRERIEDPERMIHQLILDMEEELEIARGRISAALADEKHLEREVAKLRQEVDDWLNRATDSLKRGDEAAAKYALEHKRRSQDRVKSLCEVYETQEKQTRKLQEAFYDLEDKIRQARRKQRLFLAKMALSQLHDHLDEFGIEGDGFERGLSDQDRKEQLERELADLKRRVANDEA